MSRRPNGERIIQPLCKLKTRMTRYRISKSPAFMVCHTRQYVNACPHLWSYTDENFAKWDGSVGPEPVPGVDIPDKWSGYCTHGTVLFPTWHREL